ncbi:MurR/RpiR family transcriptional regulator [Anaerosinus gibii]|uniref:MurR/RpiR family transcriptional regulator n=1 Tax=Selenobaculum gibii TaxID=3054208 RepID=A0A9Y2AIE2_9FIRM|nr:MurR/RpiR family transcriptional regulator [Selenobaculum gbiensis]WIW70341.1 MurR/RpiR family transcriptional regulator [Selenobaculum gbiensis]
MTIEERGYEAKLSKNESLVFEFIMKEKERACFLTSTDIATELNVSDSSVIRLSRKLGYGSFAELKKDLQNEVSQKSFTLQKTNVPYKKLKQVDKLSEFELIEAIHESAKVKIMQDLTTNQSEKYIEVANLLKKAKKIYVVGFRTCSGMAEYFANMLSFVFPFVNHVTSVSSMVDELMDIDESDVMILISYPRYSKGAYYALEMAKEAGARIVVFTDKLTSPITNGATKVIANNIDSLTFTNSFINLILSIEVVVSLVAKQNEKQSSQRLKRIEKYLNKTGQY